MSSEVSFSRINPEDTPRLYDLAVSNDGNKSLTPQNFNHWYFCNPFKSNSLWKVVSDGEIEGYATTNNFRYSIEGKELLIAFPQNVLTSEKIRGGGLFGKLYYLTEKDNLEEKGVDMFLTSTGEMSTDIFLKKFGYVRGYLPAVLVKFASLPAMFSRGNYSLIKDINTIVFNTDFQIENARIKDMEYLKWRYAQCNKKVLRVISVSVKNEIVGYAFLIVRKMKGLPTLMLADMICKSEDHVADVIDACHVFATRNMFAAVIMFELSYNCRRRGINITMKNHLNFLSKGKTPEETTWLSTRKLNYFFGDLDFFW
ncbi:MAG: hypothetical protein JSS90_03580 [Bacteroidetes bacterium]|jgi:hypothetical protein|nr:hypothetical protein [Bacteroidota bacterium]